MDLDDLFTLKAFNFRTLVQRTTWLSRNEKLKKKTGMGIEQYFMVVKGDDLYFNPIVFSRVITKAIDTGLNWIDERELVAVSEKLNRSVHPE